MRRRRRLIAALLLWAVVSAPIAPALGEEEDCADAWITAKVKSRLMGRSGFGAFKISIDTEGCVVTLDGCVDTAENRQRAVEIARKVKKVRNVRNRLTLCPPEGSKETDRECPDAMITAEVKSVILGKEGLTAFKIDVDTEECVVTLNGCVGTKAQIGEAAAAARKAKGVRDVVSRLTVCPQK
jgi:hyperosmotically inducible protein